jgi:hypothetical protein
LPFFKRRISTELGLSALIVFEFVGIIILFLSTSIVSYIVAQAILFLISMIIIWYAAHPLSHYIVAKIFDISTLFFFVGPSDMGRNGPSYAKKISPFLVTVGTKIDREKFRALSKNRRACVSGIGAIVGLIILALIELVGIFASRLSLAAVILGGLFFLFTLGTELTLSVRSGDIAKMKKELSC